MMPLNSTSNMHKYAPANQNDRGEAGDKLPPHQIPRKADDANGSIEMQKRSHKNKEGPLTIAGDPAELRVFYTGRRGMALPCRRTRTEKYLIALCVLLFCTCITFIVIAFARDSDAQKVCLTEHCVRTAAQLLESIDLNADPCHDFFQYACGSWNKKHIIPEDKSSYNMFEQLHDNLQVKLKRLLEEPIGSYDTNSTIKAKMLYTSCINISKIEEIGDAPIMAVLKGYGGWPVVVGRDWVNSGSWRLEEMLGSLRRVYNAPLIIDAWVSADDKISDVNILQLDQPSLGMPSREYYLKEEERSYKDAYLKYMVNVACLLGANETLARLDMAEVLAFEVELAKVTTPQAERHDTGAMYTKMTVAELQRRVPEINWLLYFNTFMTNQIEGSERVVSFGMKYLEAMAKLVRKQSERVLANYLLWRLVLGLVPEMTAKYQKERNEYRRVLQGVSREKVRWQKCVEYVNERMGMAVGRLFVRDNFDVESKHTALEMIHNIREAFTEILEDSDWMDDATKAVAKEKANAINERIGYPEFILNETELDSLYQGLHFSTDSYFENILKVEQHDSSKNLAKLRQPVEKEKWEQDPAVVNAFYNPNMNDIVFPAGILQSLFYSAHFPKSLNYGGIGVVIGHEITHGFDDKGRQYDKNGNLRQWWNNETIIAFRKRAQCIVDQYSTYRLEPFDLKIDGKNTQGENIADNGGLKESFKAYRKWVDRNGEEPPLPGMNLSHNQLFFLNYAQIWCGIMRVEEALHKVRTSVHSPGPIRVLGPLSNSPDFSEAYNCPAGSRMNPHHKCAVW